MLKIITRARPVLLMASLILMSFISLQVAAKDYYIAASAKHWGKGTQARPLKTINGCLNTYDNRIINNEFYFSEGAALSYQGSNGLIENNLFSYTDLSCIGGTGQAAVLMHQSTNTRFSRNTLNTTGCAFGVIPGKGGNIVLNDISATGLIQHDGAGIHAMEPAQSGLKINQNWVHDIHTGGIRLDTIWDGSYIGRGTQVSRNVLWDSIALVIKGDEHLVSHNTSFDNVKSDLIVFIDDDHGGINKKTKVVNNLSGKYSPHLWKKNVAWPATMVNENNIEANISQVLRDPQNLDFRPGIKGQDLGSKVLKTSYLGKAPDPGAYEANTHSYWIPGRKEQTASMPVPPSGSLTVKADADLMWRPAYQANKHQVYVGTDKTKLLKATQDDKEYMGVFNGENNILTNLNLVPGQIYFWRVDAVDEQGKVIKGRLWAFKVKNDTEHASVNN